MRLAAMVALFSQFFDEVIIVTCGTHSALIGAIKYCISPSAHAVLTFFVYLHQ